VAARTGVGIPATKETGQPEGCPARATITQTAQRKKQNRCPKNGCIWAQTQKKTHGASGVAFVSLGFLRPAADFATAERLYQGMAPARKPGNTGKCSMAENLNSW